MIRVQDRGARDGPIACGPCGAVSSWVLGVLFGREDRARGLRCLAMLVVHRRQSLHRRTRPVTRRC